MMQYFETSTADLKHGDVVNLEMQVVYEFSDSFSHTFRLLNGGQITLPRRQRLNDQIVWHGRH